MGYPIGLSNTTDDLKFLLVLTSDHITGATGKTPTVTILKNGATSFITPAGAVSELASGWYKVAANAIDANTLGPLLLHATATGCDPRDDTFSVVNYNPSIVQPLSPATTATFGTTTALQIIKGALDLIGVQDWQEPIEGALAVDALRRLNNMVSGWGNQRLTIPATVREVFALVANQASYTIGPSGDFDTVRPLWLRGAAWTDGTQEGPMSLLTDDAYEAIVIKTQASSLPQQLYYNKTFPLGTIYLWPVPDSALYSLVLYSDQALTGFSSLTTPYAFAPGYQEALEYQLARRLTSPYRGQMDADAQKIASDSLHWLKVQNTRLVDAVIDIGLTRDARGAYNIYTDTPHG